MARSPFEGVQLDQSIYLAAIIEGSDDAIIGKTLDGIVTSWNPGAERILGYQAEEMIGEPIHRLVPADRPDDVARILATIRRGERIEHFETDRVRKDGRRIRVSLTVSPIRDSSGKIVGASKIARDVTDRHRAETELRETFAVLETLNRTSIQLSAELDTEKLVRVVTEAGTKITGAEFGAFFYNVTDERGESYMLYTLAGADAETFRSFPMPRNTAIFEPTFRGGGIVRFDDVTKDPRYGKNAPYRGTPPGHLPVKSYLAVPVVLRGEVLGGLFFGNSRPGVFGEREERFVIGLAAQAAIAMDNARLYESERAARAKAEAASRAKDEFLSTVSHELRTPLSSMMGWTAVLRQGKLSPEATVRALETIKRSGRLQAELIDDLLDVSRIVGGYLKVDRQPTVLNKVIGAALDGVHPDAVAKGVRVEVSLGEDVVVDGDAIRLQQVVANVIGNAVKFTPTGRAVHVEMEVAPPMVRLHVRDEGQGIPADFLPFVFEPFRQEESVKKRKTGGLGLGLAIAKALAERHGGSIAAASPGEDAGSTFTIELPLSSQADAPSAA